MQQLGRGLRKAPDKEFVVILDFIGNYQSNFLIPVALADDRSYNKDNMRRALAVDLRQIPGASSVHFDPIVRKRIYESIDRASVSDTKLIRTSYEQLKAKLGRIPGLLDFDRFGSIDAVKFFEKFGSYYAFLEKYEKSFTTRLSTRAAGMLAFLSVKAGAGRRVSEAIVIRDLLAGRPDLETGLREGLARYGIEPSAAHLSSVFGFLSNRFVKTADEAKQRAGMVFVEYDAALGWRMATELREELGRSAEFRTMLAELAGFMVSRYEARFSKRYAGTDLVLYEKIYVRGRLQAAQLADQHERPEHRRVLLREDDEDDARLRQLPQGRRRDRLRGPLRLAVAHRGALEDEAQDNVGRRGPHL